jgi:hypothetical protein
MFSPDRALSLIARGQRHGAQRPLALRRATGE